MISICLSIYNGSLYLLTQLQSIENQSYNLSQIILIVRDDGSTDASCSVLQNFIDQTSLHVIFLEDKTNFGIKKSFELLMSKALEMDSEYIMFCDQDDIWKKDKIEKTIMRMQKIEKQYLKTPLLIHGDLQVVNDNLSVISPSFWKYQNVDPAKDTFNHFLFKNSVTGCTIMVNRQLAQMVLPIPNEAIMHDWWIAMVASAFGKISYINEPLMLYRQHDTNDTGAKNYGWGYFFKKFIERPNLDKYLVQAEIFLYIFEDKLEDNSKEMLLLLKHFPSLNKLQKIRIIIKYKLWKNGFMRNVGLLVNA